MPEPILPLRHHDVLPGSIPTGERMLDRSTPPYLVWVPPRKCIVLGNSQDPQKELNVEAVQRDGIPVFKRMGGGGAVLLSPGCVCLGFRFAKDKRLSIRDFFAKGSRLVIDVARENLGLRLESRGISDLACANASWQSPETHSGHPVAYPQSADPAEKKVAGCSLYMPRDYILYLVSILVDPDFGDVDKYLSHPSKEPEYRAGRTHRDFLTSLAAATGYAVKPSAFAQWLLQKIPVEPGSDLDWEYCREP